MIGASSHRGPERPRKTRRPTTDEPWPSAEFAVAYLPRSWHKFAWALTLGFVAFGGIVHPWA